MQKCELSISLNRSSGEYLPGDMVEGVVRVVANRDVSCSGLILSSMWKTHGRGNVESGEPNRELLFAGKWSAGSAYNYEFSVPAGSWPPSYEGTVVSIGHYLSVKADIPWSRDPQEVCPYWVKPRRFKQEEVVESEPKRKSTDSLPVHLFKRFWWLPVIVLPLTVVFINAVVKFIKYGVIEEGMDFFVVMVLITVPLVLFFLVFSGLSTRVLGCPELVVENDSLRFGGIVRAQFLTTTRKDVLVNSMIAELKATESCTSGSGSSAKHYEHVICKARQVFQSAAVLPEGKALSFPFRFKLPEAGPCSVQLESNNLSWELNVRVEIPECPDWQETVFLQIEPPLLNAKMPT